MSAFARAHRGPRALPSPAAAPPPPEIDTDSTVSLVTAFHELTPFEFAYFTRLMVEPALSFRAGRKKLAESIRVPLRNLDRALKQLERKGYLIVEGGAGPGKPSRIRFLKRLAIVGPNHFVTLAHGLALASVADDAGEAEHAPDVAGVQEHAPNLAHVNPLYDDELPVEQTPVVASDLLARAAAWRPKSPIPTDEPEVEAVPETHATSGASCSLSSSRSSLNKEKLKERKREKAELLRGARARGQLIAQKRMAEAKKAKGAYGSDPIAREVLMSPASPSAQHAAKMLERAPNERRRAALSIRLGAEFRRIYTSIREKYEPDYRMSYTDFKACEAAAATCVRYHVTPVEVIEYWRVRVPKFTSLPFPLVRFLAGDARAEEVAISKPDHPLAAAAKDARRAAAKSAKPAPVRNDFERPRDPDLHERATTLLVSEGHKVTAGDVTTLLAMVESAEMRKAEKCSGGTKAYNALATTLLVAKREGRL